MKQLIYILTLLTLVSVGACSKHNDPIPTTTTSRTVMVYLEMNNNLSEYGEKNIADMVTSTTKENLNGGKIIAYIKTYNESKIAFITYDKNNKGTLVTLREVDRSINMSNWEMLTAINELIVYKNFAPNPFNYINITRFCGLGMTLPLDEYSNSWKQCYKNTEWFNSCYNFTYSI